MLDLSQPTRQSKKSILYYLSKSLRGLAAVGLYAIFGISSWATIGWSTAILLLFAVLSLISPLTRYYFFTFHIANGELIINSGVLLKQRKSVPLERIQSINLNQNIFQRLLDISSLDIETAGSTAKEIEIPALDTAFAKALKDTLKSKATSSVFKPAFINDGGQQLENEIGYRETTDDAVNNEIAAQEQPIQTETQVEKEPQTILELGITDLLKIGITQNHLKSGGIALGVVIGFWYKIKDIVERFLGDPFENWDKEIEATVVHGKVHMTDYTSTIVVAFVSFCIVSVLVSVVLAITKYWDFKMVLDSDTLEIQMGLFNRQEVKMPLSKIQILEFHGNPLRRLLGYETAMIFQAQADDTKKTALDVPACTAAMRMHLQQMLFEEIPVAVVEELKPSAWSYMRLAIYITSVFMLPLVAVAIYFDLWSGAVVALILLVFIAWMYYKIGLASAVQRDDRFIVFKKGWLFPSTIITPIFKVQATDLSRSVFLKKRKEIHFTAHTAAGSRILRYLNETDARALAHTINSSVLLSNRSWM